MGWSEIISFTIITSLLVISPGPNGVLIAKTVPTSGRSAGFANIAGFVSAFYLHGLLAVLGISVILVQSATAFTIVKYIGAAYLCWVGAKALYASFKGAEPAAETTPSKKKMTLSSAYFEGLLTNTLNPKVSMFYLAAFPQFISMGDATITSSILLIFIHSVLNAIWFTSMVLLLSKLSGVARNGNFQRYLKGVTGMVFIGFGAKLATLKP
ncbi:LysE family translocator [Flexibacterium corallicola]|uniref:LysE family translocator n=1 Tax=Flexibacterium corallicola TaxID=3037259 RepID=UPI00286FA549|nr:LysE family translocator [Pseudovibrio sp. M1P-2-3]